MLSNNNNEKFLIDVAKDRIYQNQDEEYYKEYLKWRTDEKNPYGYRFIHDTREHSYVDGEGYLHYKEDVAERISLYKCLGLLGVTMLVMTCIDLFQDLILNLLAPNTIGNITYFSDIYTERNINFGIAVISGFMTLARFIVPAAVFKLSCKIPQKVAMPRSKCDHKLVGSSVVIMLVILVLSRIGNFYMSKILGFVGVDTVYAYVSFGSNLYVTLLNISLYCVLIPIVSEYLFRGLILQTFRQFGDLFAIIITCFVCGFSYYDLPNLGYGICSSIVLALFTIRTGSLRTAIFMNMSAHILNYILSVLSISDITYGRIFETVICTLIVGLSVIVYSRLISSGDWSFNIQTSSNSQIPLGKKVKMIFTSNSIAIWIVVGIIMFFLNSRLL